MKSNAPPKPTQAATPLLVIGYGNTLRRDDGVGPRIVHALARPLAALGHASIIAHQLLPEHAHAVASAKLVIFVDAAADSPPGHIAWRQIKARPTASPAATHHCTPAAILALSKSLYHAAPRAVLVSIGAGSLELGTTLTPLVARAKTQVIRQIRAMALNPAASKTLPPPSRPHAKHSR